MKVEKAYILTIDTPIAQEYLLDTIKSCDKIKLPWEEFRGFHDITPEQALENFGFPSTIPLLGEELRGTMCMLGHMAMVKKIWEKKECAVILEHDAVMLHPVTIDIPDGEIVVLGYKLKDIDRYNYKEAGLPKKLVPIEAHEGSHAYAITWKTAGMILDEFYSKGVIDNGTDDHYFLKSREKYTKIPLTISDPISALGWVRESTIRPSESQERNFLFIQSFVKNLESK